MATDLPSGTPAGVTTFPLAHERWFSTGPGTRSFFVTGEEGGAASGTTTTNARVFNLTCQYHPYAF
jgi:hypothetical protein